MTRSALTLAALASAAVPGLDPTGVEAAARGTGPYDLAFVTDSQDRRWVVRAPRTRAAGAQMDVTLALLERLARRLPYAVPSPAGFAALKEGGRAAVYRFLPGRPLVLGHLPAGPGLAAELGRGIAALHNVDVRLVEDAGVPAYDADTYRTRRLAELDRAAATGYVPTALLTRWERALEDVSLWRFAPTATHGDLAGEDVLVEFADEDDAASGRLAALTGWEHVKVADPADDFAGLAGHASPAAFDTVLEAYAQAREERPDANLERRARLAHELRQVSGLLTAIGTGDVRYVDAYVERLRRLEEQTRHEPPLAPAPVGPRAPRWTGPAEGPADPAEPSAADRLDAGRSTDTDRRTEANGAAPANGLTAE